MILTVDIGNTNVSIGVFDGNRLLFDSRFSTDISRTKDQYAIEIKAASELYGIDIKKVNGAIISSVVPELTPVLKSSILLLTGVNSMVLGPGVKSGLNIKIDNPAQLGADLVAGAVAVLEKYPLPCLLMDLGTATKISVLDKEGVYRGCTISPGVGISINALSDAASLLPSLDLSVSTCSAFGTNTVSSMQAGIILGTAAMLDGLTERIEDLLGERVNAIVATGGHSRNIIGHCKHKIIFEPNLLLYGLKAIYDKNKKK